MASVWTVLLLGACAGRIEALYAETREAVLAPVPPAPPQWAPDAVLLLPDDLLEALVGQALEAVLDGVRNRITVGGVFAGASVVPKAALRKLEVSPGSACDACLTVRLRLKLSAEVVIGPVAMQPVQATADATVQLEVVDEPAAGTTPRRLVARVRQVDRLDVGGADGVQLVLDGALERWVQDLLSNRLPPIPLAEPGAVPLRALRVRAVEGALVVEALTEGGAEATALRPAVPPGHWGVAVAQDALLALARRAAFEQGVLDLDVYLDPRGLTVDGDRFALDLRVWRLAGRGWWRDYRVSGAVNTTGQRLRLEPDAVEEVDRSRWAGLADPLALLARSRILDAIAEGATQSIKARSGVVVAGLEVTADVRSVEGVRHEAGGDVVVAGTLGSHRATPDDGGKPTKP